MQIQNDNDVIEKLDVKTLTAEKTDIDKTVEMAKVIDAINATSNNQIKHVDNGFSELVKAIKHKFMGALTEAITPKPIVEKKEAIQLKQHPVKESSKPIGRKERIRKSQQAAPAVTQITNNVSNTSSSHKTTQNSNATTKINNTDNSIKNIENDNSKKNTNKEHKKPNKDQSDTKTAKVASKKVGMPSDILDQYHTDSKGRLRNERGAFASKSEQLHYQQSKEPAQEVNGSYDDKKQQSLLASLSKSVAKIAAFGSIGRALNNDTGTAAGVAAGGSYFLAAQEIAQMAGQVKDSLAEKDIHSVSDAYNAAKNKVGSAKDKAVDIGKAVKEYVKATPLLAATASKKAKDKATDKIEQFKHAKNGVAKRLESDGPIKKMFKRFKPLPSKTDYEQLKVIKSDAKDSRDSNKKTIYTLDAIKDAIVMAPSNAGGSSGGSLSDLFDGDGGDDSKNRKRKRKGRNRKPKGKLGKFFSKATSKVGGLFGGAGEAIGGMFGGKVGAMLGGAKGVAGKALGLGGRVLSKAALPLTLAMGAYDGISGYNDKEAQTKAFNLKEGQEASTGQKLSMAAGSMLSMGGLTDLIGISPESIAQSLYKLGGGKIQKAEGDSTVKSVSGSQSPANSSNATINITPEMIEQSAKQQRELKSLNGGVTPHQPAVNKQANTAIGEAKTDSLDDYMSSRNATTATMVAKSPVIGNNAGVNGTIAPIGAASVNSIAAAPIPNQKQPQDIEQVIKTEKVMSKASTTSSKKEVTETKDPEMLKVLKDIKKVLDKDQKPTPVQQNRSLFIGGNHNNVMASIPRDFSDPAHRAQANNIG